MRVCVACADESGWFHRESLFQPDWQQANVCAVSQGSVDVLTRPQPQGSLKKNKIQYKTVLAETTSSINKVKCPDQVGFFFFCRLWQQSWTFQRTSSATSACSSSVNLWTEVSHVSLWRCLLQLLELMVPPPRRNS